MDRGFVIGIELNENQADICRYDYGEKEPVSVLAEMGGGQESFPSCLAYTGSSDTWKYGFEAENLIIEHKAVPVPRFFRKVMRAEEFKENGKTFSAARILSEFLKLALYTAGVEDLSTDVRALVLTVPKTGRLIAETAENAFAILGLSDGRAFLIDHAESFFYHTFRSSAVYKRETALYNFPDATSVEYISIGSDGITIPYTVSVHGTGNADLSMNDDERDAQFIRFIENTLGCTEWIFLTGPGFEKTWAKESLNLLCKGARKVYHGSNLFSRGACYAAMDKCGILRHNDIRFIGDDLVTQNIWMDMSVDGESEQIQLIGAGVHWYEAESEIEFIMDDPKELTLKAADIRDGTVTRIKMVLDGIPKRPRRTTRIRLRIRYIDSGKCRIQAEDFGFGELFPATHKIWEEILE